MFRVGFGQFKIERLHCTVHVLYFQYYCIIYHISNVGVSLAIIIDLKSLGVKDILTGE